MTDWKTFAAHTLCWLNGRACPITIMHEGAPVVLWAPEWDITIEDAVLQFITKHKINMDKEAGLESA